jgi:penicillin-insensitive murein DD-endopeptidase
MARFSMTSLLIPNLLAAALAGGMAQAQTVGTLDPKPLPPLAKPDDPSTAANQLFGRKAEPAPLEARVIGFYASGCLAGARALPINGKTWQVMRLSRNRNWGHPNLIAHWSAWPRKRRRSAGTGFWSATWRSRAAARC